MVVLKFGGSSVANPERLRRVAGIIQKFRASSPPKKVLVVVSAMGDSTDDLINLAGEVSKNSKMADRRREMDMLLSTGERVTMALLSLALADLGIPAQSFTGSQSGIITDSNHGDAKIVEIRPHRLREALDAGRVVIVAGFQGVSPEKEITTLGRGGSDTSAVALGAVFEASTTFIYTDVDGIFSADPRKIPKAKQIPEIHWSTVLEMASRGTQVLHPRCVEIAAKFKVGLVVRNTLKESTETRINTTQNTKDLHMLESPKVLGVTLEENINLESAIYHKEPAESLGSLRVSGKYIQFSRSAGPHGSHTRISLVGVGLHRMPSLGERSEKILLESEINLENLVSHISASAAEFIFETRDKNISEELLKKFHKVFLET